jgi:hypothetical protein
MDMSASDLLAPSPDPNWFYSTLAQSTAAIVGLAGGFLVARLIALRERVGEERERLVSKFENLIAQARKEASRYDGLANAIEEELRDSDDWLQQQEDRGYVEIPSHAKYGVRPPSPEELERLGELPALLREAADSWNELDRAVIARSIVKNRPLTSRTEWLPGLTMPPAFTNYPTAPDTYWMAVVQQRDWLRWRWTDYVRFYDEVRASTQAFRARMIPGSIYVLLGILGLLMIAGVIAPMLYLSARGGSSKSLLLVGFIPLALAFVGYLVFEVIRLRQAADMSRSTF